MRAFRVERNATRACRAPPAGAPQAPTVVHTVPLGQLPSPRWSPPPDTPSRRACRLRGPAGPPCGRPRLDSRGHGRCAHVVTLEAACHARRARSRPRGCAPCRLVAFEPLEHEAQAGKQGLGVRLGRHTVSLLRWRLLWDSRLVGCPEGHTTSCCHPFLLLSFFFNGLQQELGFWVKAWSLSPRHPRSASWPCLAVRTPRTARPY